MGGTGGATDGGTEGGVRAVQGGGGAGGATTAFRVRVTNLTSDQANEAANRDRNLVNAWGLAENPQGPLFWVSDNGTGLATIYGPSGAPTSLVVTIPSLKSGTPSTPTGQVFNDSSAFRGDRFIFATEDGTIAGWQSGNTAVTRANESNSGAVYKGLAIARVGNSSALLAANFHAGTIDVFDDNYALANSQNKFTDPNMPAGFAPFNVMVSDAKIYVAYAKQSSDKHDDVAGSGNGHIDVFNMDGTFSKRLVTGGDLNSPWGMAVVPNVAGGTAGMLLVGNFGDGRVHAYDLTNGTPLGAVVDESGKNVEIDGLWALLIPSSSSGTSGAGGAGGAGAGATTVYFTAGPNDEKHGLFGRMDVVR
jgi:uncharacterized protein (TIGR03118 family)